MAEQCINAGVQGLHNLLQSWLDALIWILTSDKREDGFSLVPSIISPILCTYIVIRQQWAKNNTQHQNPCFKIKKKKKKDQQPNFFQLFQMKYEQLNDSTLPNHCYPKSSPTACISTGFSPSGNRTRPTAMLLFFLG